jgi:hypothetical protein
MSVPVIKIIVELIVQIEAYRRYYYSIQCRYEFLNFHNAFFMKAVGEFENT